MASGMSLLRGMTPATLLLGATKTLAEVQYPYFVPSLFRAYFLLICLGLH